MASRAFTVSGILSTGGSKTIRWSHRLRLRKQILGKPGAVRRVYVSALTKPEDALARRDPKTMNQETFDRWYCSPYVQSIAFQLQEVIPHSHADQIRQVAQNEGTVLSRDQGLDAADHAGRVVRVGAGGFSRDGNSDLRAAT